LIHHESCPRSRRIEDDEVGSAGDGILLGEPLYYPYAGSAGAIPPAPPGYRETTRVEVLPERSAGSLVRFDGDHAIGVPSEKGREVSSPCKELDHSAEGARGLGGVPRVTRGCSLG
jgi:hypothetical protein